MSVMATKPAELSDMCIVNPCPKKYTAFKHIGQSAHISRLETRLELNAVALVVAMRVESQTLQQAAFLYSGSLANL